MTVFDPANPSTFRLGPGNFSFQAEITDTWGAVVSWQNYVTKKYRTLLLQATFDISSRTEFIYPTNEERIAFEESGVKEAIQGSGDSKALMLILSAELAISSAIGPIERNDSTSGCSN